MRPNPQFIGIALDYTEPRKSRLPQIALMLVSIAATLVILREVFL